MEQSGTMATSESSGGEGGGGGGGSRLLPSTNPHTLLLIYFPRSLMVCTVYNSVLLK